MYLLDTNVISGLRRSDKNVAISKWVGSIPASALFLSSVTIMEIESGIARRRKVDPPHAVILEIWLEGTIVDFDARILPVDVAVARRWGVISAAIGNQNPDLAIAATALEHGLIVATRNVRHFLPTGVAVFDPFSGMLHKPD